MRTLSGKAHPLRRWLWPTALAGALLVAGARYHDSKTIRPSQKDWVGGSFRLSPTSSLAKADEPAGILDITLHLDNGRANRLNSRRDAKFLTQSPQAFGPAHPFKPLTTVVATGPGNLEISGDGPTGTARTKVPEGTHSIEVYPDFLPERIFTGEAGETETLRFYFEPASGGRTLQGQETLTWSGPRELFLSSKNLIDLAALTKSVKAGKETNLAPTQWLETWGKEIQKENLAYESESASFGWQPIRTLEEMRAAEAANCLDIALLTAQEAKSKGYSPHILANSGHAVCAVAPKGEGASNAIFFEGTAFLNQDRKAKPKVAPPEPGSWAETWEKIVPPKALEKPEDSPNRAPPREPEPPDTFSIDLERWETIFRTPREN